MELTGLLSLRDVDQLLTSSAIRTPAVRLVRDGVVLPEREYTAGARITGRPLTGLVDARKTLALFRSGATIVFQGLQRYHPMLSRIVAELELELGHPCQANAYLTPAGAQGFAVHADTHDVFVFQTAGAKQWQIHTPGGVEDVTLVPGLVLYLPTGTPHAARAQDGVSLHVTIGINQLTWRGLVRRVAERALAGVPDDHLPAGYLDEPALLRAGLADHLAELVARLRAADPDAEAEAEVRRFLTSRPPRLGGGLLDTAAVVTDDTVLRRRTGHPCVVLDRGERIEVLLGDRVLTMPAWVRAAVDQVRARTELRPADLPLDEQSRLVLCRRLVREGLLEVVS